MQQVQHQMFVTSILYCDFEVFFSQRVCYYKNYERFEL